MISFDDSTDPVIAIDPDMSVIEAQVWVRREGTPVVVFGREDGEPVQSVLVFVGSQGKPVLEPFWHITDPNSAVAAARRYLSART